jgi:hypothetical protein
MTIISLFLVLNFMYLALTPNQWLDKKILIIKLSNAIEAVRVCLQIANEPRNDCKWGK